jgi:pyruvate dehydrogenase E1 component alpha subunit
MILVRAFEEKAGELFEQNLIPGFIHLSIGEEASSVGTCSILRPDNYVAGTHCGNVSAERGKVSPITPS